MGPNVKRLIAERIATTMVAGTGGFEGTIKNLLEPGRLQGDAKAATEWVTQAISAVRACPGENPWRGASDETIAGELLKRVKEQRGR